MDNEITSVRQFVYTSAEVGMTPGNQVVRLSPNTNLAECNRAKEMIHKTMGGAPSFGNGESLFGIVFVGGSFVIFKYANVGRGYDGRLGTYCLHAAWITRENLGKTPEQIVQNTVCILDQLNPSAAHSKRYPEIQVNLPSAIDVSSRSSFAPLPELARTIWGSESEFAVKYLLDCYLDCTSQVRLFIDSADDMKRREGVFLILSFLTRYNVGEFILFAKSEFYQLSLKDLQRIPPNSAEALRGIEKYQAIFLNRLSNSFWNGQIDTVWQLSSDLDRSIRKLQNTVPSSDAKRLSYLRLLRELIPDEGEEFTGDIIESCKRSGFKDVLVDEKNPSRQFGLSREWLEATINIDGIYKRDDLAGIEGLESKYLAMIIADQGISPDQDECRNWAFRKIVEHLESLSFVSAPQLDELRVIRKELGSASEKSMKKIYDLWLGKKYAGDDADILSKIPESVSLKDVPGFNEWMADQFGVRISNLSSDYGANPDEYLKGWRDIYSDFRRYILEDSRIERAEGNTVITQTKKEIEDRLDLFFAPVQRNRRNRLGRSDSTADEGVSTVFEDARRVSEFYQYANKITGFTMEARLLGDYAEILQKGITLSKRGR